MRFEGLGSQCCAKLEVVDERAYPCHHACAASVVEEFDLLRIALWWVDEAVLELRMDKGGQLGAHFLLPWLAVVGSGSLAFGVGSALLPFLLSRLNLRMCSIVLGNSGLCMSCRIWRER